MTPDQILVTVAGLAGAATVAWFFWFRRSEGVQAATITDGYQEQMALVKGGCTPDTIRVVAGRPVRLLFRRDETAACSEQVVLPDPDRSASLPPVGGRPAGVRSHRSRRARVLVCDGDAPGPDPRGGGLMPCGGAPPTACWSGRGRGPSTR